MTTGWPSRDRRQALTHDLIILMGRGLRWDRAADQLNVPRTTAYRWLHAAGVTVTA